MVSNSTNGTNTILIFQKQNTKVQASTTIEHTVNGTTRRRGKGRRVVSGEKRS
jgi:hypothetical protein